MPRIPRSSGAISYRERDMMNKFGAKLVEKIGLHKLIVIRNVQANDSLAVQSFGKLSSESIHVRLLHAKDDVRPSQMPFGDNDASDGLRAD